MLNRLRAELFVGVLMVGLAFTSYYDAFVISKGTGGFVVDIGFDRLFLILIALYAFCGCILAYCGYVDKHLSGRQLFALNVPLLFFHGTVAGNIIANHTALSGGWALMVYWIWLVVEILKRRGP